MNIDGYVKSGNLFTAIPGEMIPWLRSGRCFASDCFVAKLLAMTDYWNKFLTTAIEIIFDDCLKRELFHPILFQAVHAGVRAFVVITFRYRQFSESFLGY